MDVYDYLTVEHGINKNDICCGVSSNGKDAAVQSLTLDYPLYIIIDKLRRSYRLLNKKQSTEGDNLLEKLPVFTLSFYRAKNPLVKTLIEPNVFVVTPEELCDNFVLLMKLPLDSGVFLPLVISKSIFHHHESATKNNSLDKFWNYPLEKQLFALKTFSDPKASSVLLLSLIAKTNENCYGTVKTSGFETKQFGYCFYKIHNHSLILFGLSGPDTFVESQTAELYEKMHELHAVLFQCPRTFNDSRFEKWNMHFVEGGWKVYTRYNENTRVRPFVGEKMKTLRPTQDESSGDDKIIASLVEIIHAEKKIIESQGETIKTLADHLKNLMMEEDGEENDEIVEESDESLPQNVDQSLVVAQNDSMVPVDLYQ